MALTSDQQHQVLRLPIVDAAVDEKDAFGFLGLPQVLTSPSVPSLATSIKRQVLRLPTVDAAVDEVDAYGFLGTPFPVAVGGALVEEFSVDWNIDPTSLEVVIEFTGRFEGAINSFVSAFSGVTAGDLRGGGDVYVSVARKPKRRVRRLEIVVPGPHNQQKLPPYR